MKNILIIGAGVAGRDVLREVKKNPDLGYKIVGFVDDDPEKIKQKILGIRVLGGLDKLKSSIKKRKIDEVIIAIPSAEGERISAYVKICSKTKIPFRIIPRVKEIIEGKARLSSLRKVEVEDLLGRPVVKADIEKLKQFLKGKSILVTGAAGSIGSELSRQIVVYLPKAVVFLDWWENGLFDLQQELSKNTKSVEMEFIVGNIQDRKKLKLIFEKFKIDYVFHTAAYKHVPAMEDNPEEAIKNNVFGTLTLALAAQKAKVTKFIFVSTDKAANPVNVMGASKLIAETIVKSLSGETKFITVRLGNVLDSFGSVLPIFRKQIEVGGPVTVSDPKMTRYFMTIPEATQLILKAASLGVGKELFVLDMGHPLKILELAKNLIRLSGYVPGKDIKVVFTGRRKGEKLIETLFNEKEADSVDKPTADSRIFISESKGIATESLKESLLLLKKAADSCDEKIIRIELRKLIRNFP